MLHVYSVLQSSKRNFLSTFLGDEDQSLSNDDRKKRPRTAFTAAQIKALENEFEKNKYLSVSKRMQLSKQLKLTETQVSHFTTYLLKDFLWQWVEIIQSVKTDAQEIELIYSSLRLNLTFVITTLEVITSYHSKIKSAIE